MIDANAAKKDKLITEDKVTMSGCLNALKKLRHCEVCPFRFDKEKCKSQKCVPSPVIAVMEFAIRTYFYEKKKLKALSKSAPKEQVITNEEDDFINHLDI